MGAAQQLYHQRSLGGYVVQIDGLAQKQRHGVLFAQGVAHHAIAFAAHCAPSFRLFKKLRMPRSCPSYPEQRHRLPAR